MNFVLNNNLGEHLDLSLYFFKFIFYSRLIFKRSRGNVITDDKRVGLGSYSISKDRKNIMLK